MEKWELSEFCDDVENYMKANDLIFRQYTALSTVSDERYQQYKEAVADILLDRTYSEVRALDTVFALQGKESDTIPMLKKQLSETQKGIENMLNAIQSGIFNESTKKRLDELEERKSQLEVSILQEELQHPVLTKEQILFWLHKFRTTDISDKAERQRLIDSFVNAIYLYDDKTVLVWNYKDGTKTVSLKDIKGSDLCYNWIKFNFILRPKDAKSFFTFINDKIVQVCVGETLSTYLFRAELVML